MGGKYFAENIFYTWMCSNADVADDPLLEARLEALHTSQQAQEPYQQHLCI